MERAVRPTRVPSQRRREDESIRECIVGRDLTLPLDFFLCRSVSRKRRRNNGEREKKGERNLVAFPL